MSFSYNPFPETNIPALPNHAAIIVVGGGGEALIWLITRSWKSAIAHRGVQHQLKE